MPQKQLHKNCVFFDNSALCPHTNDSIMKEFIQDMDIIEGCDTILNYNKSDDVNKICNSCNSFKEKLRNFGDVDV